MKIERPIKLSDTVEVSDSEARLIRRLHLDALLRVLIKLLAQIARALLLNH